MTPEPRSDHEPIGTAEDATSRGRGTVKRDVWQGLDQSWVMTLELLSGILVWGGAGWLLDRWLGTGPWLFGIGVFVGFGAGLYLVWIRAAQAQRKWESQRAEILRTREVDREGRPRASE